MKAFIRTLAIALAAVLAIGAPSPAYAADAYNAEATAQPEGGAVFLVAEEGNFQALSTLGANKTNDPNSDAWACDGADDPACSPTKAKNISGPALLPVCKTASDENCIVSLELAAPGEQFELATYVRNATGQVFPAVPSLNYPGGSTTSLWEAKNAPSASGTTSYAVVAKQRVGRNNGGKFTAWDFSATVVPYRELKGDFKDPKQGTFYEDDVKKVRNSVFGIGEIDDRCAWNEAGTCGITQDYADGTRVKLTVRISSTIGGWFKGRLKNPNISVSKFSKNNNQISVEAEPALVHRMSYTVDDNTKITPKEKAFVEANGFGGGWKSGFTTWAPSWQPETFSYVENFRQKIKDTASGVNTYWNFSTSDGDGGSNRCLSDKTKVLGLVTTNAMVYDGGVPKFSGGFLNYKVAGLHYAPGGEELNLGVYDMVMRSDTARCLYGFSKAPLSATVSVLNEKGTKTTATTVVSEKNGWLKMAAYGFTYSNKTIKVKITKKKK